VRKIFGGRLQKAGDNAPKTLETPASHPDI
jgi:hypothetical protein